MSVENVKKFYEAVSNDASLKQKFVELSQKYQGQPLDEVKALSIMELEALPLAAEPAETPPATVAPAVVKPAPPALTDGQGDAKAVA